MYARAGALHGVCGVGIANNLLTYQLALTGGSVDYSLFQHAVLVVRASKVCNWSNGGESPHSIQGDLVLVARKARPGRRHQSASS